MAFLSDFVRHRYGFAVVGVFLATIGYIILLAQKFVGIWGRYAALFFIAAGCDTAQSILLIWLANNVAGHYKRGVSSALQLSIGNFCGLIASNIFLDSEKPGFKTGYSVALALLWMSFLCATAFLISIYRENKIRDQGGRDDRLNLPESEKDNLGDDDPRFRFVY